MKKWNVLWVFLATSLVALGGASVARADDGKAVVNVPFAFMVGGSRLPAGPYVITRTSDDGSMVTIASADGRQSVYATTIPWSSDDKTTSPELVFERLGDRYVLAEFTLESSDGHRTVLALAGAKHELAAATPNP